MTTTIELARGQRYTADLAGFPHFVEVTRAARDKSWVDIRVSTWAATWAKRQPQPSKGFPDGWVRRDWTVEDVVASETVWAEALILQELVALSGHLVAVPEQVQP